MATIYGNDRRKISGTLRLLRYYRDFINSECELAIDPESGWMRSTMTKDEARRKLHLLLDMAINRKGGLTESTRKRLDEYQVRLWRDASRLRDIRRRTRVYQFETQEIRERCSHLLSSYDD